MLSAPPTNMGMSHNNALQPTANPLRGLSAAELGRYAARQPTEIPLRYVR